MQEIYITSSLDKTEQPSLFYFCGTDNRPLLVGLHTWSYTRTNQVDNLLPYASKHNWNLLLPEFRGSNTPSNPNCRNACGSELAKQDIFDVIEYVLSHYKIDKNHIFLLGASGGGHMTLLTVAKHPELFKAAAAFVPISDLESWYHQGNYKNSLKACLGGPPTAEHIAEYRKRSPKSYMDEIAKANIKIFHGKFDSVVPVEQSINLYRDIFAKYPRSRVFLDIFDGGHEMDMERAFTWFFSQMEENALREVTG